MRGRGTSLNIKNRFEKLYTEEIREHDIYSPESDVSPRTQFIFDHSKSVLSKNESPDIKFDYSINPYRGCEHGCVYCYARPSHEYLGFSSGLDFETKIVIKKDAAKLLENEFATKSWNPQPVCFSGNTDCYQPAERKFGITRECLMVFLKFRNPVYVITKNSLIRRDVSILKKLAELNLIKVTISVTSLKPELTQILEPRTARPNQRLDTIRFLSQNDIPVFVNVAPIIPGLTDDEIPSILEAVSNKGAWGAGFIILRLPFSLKELFTSWLDKHFPERKDKILNRLKEIRGGYLYRSEFGKRFSGEGEYAELIGNMFELNCKKFGLNERNVSLRTDLFLRHPCEDQYQLF